MSIYSEVGSSFQQIGGSCPEGWVIMKGERPSPDHVASVDGSWLHPVLYIPEKVTMRQARLALLSAGLLDGVEAAINALPEPPRTVARIEWDYASEVHRASEFVTLLGAALELDKQSLDDLFLKAAEL